MKKNCRTVPNVIHWNRGSSNCNCNGTPGDGGDGGGETPNPVLSPPEEVIVTITSVGQTVFTGIVPDGKTFGGLYLYGIRQIKGVDYSLDAGGHTVTWLASNQVLRPDHKLTILLY